jgi:CubicO group peptidase (beta-lactamase class C family)
MVHGRVVQAVWLLAIATMTQAAAEPEWFGAVRGEIEARASADRFSGVVLVGRGQTVALREARGFADLERRTPVVSETRFNLGSMNKMFTAVAVAQLAQAGKLKFTDTIGVHLPDYPNKDAAARVTIEQLLTHTSGMGNIFGAQYDARRDTLLRVADYLALFASEPLRFEPGARWEYSNGGYIVLGAIVERVSGESYDDYVRRHVFEPAGMGHTGSFPKTDPPPNTAVGLTRGGGMQRRAPEPGVSPVAPPGPRRSNLEHLPGRGSPAGGGYSTAEDLMRFSSALLENRLLSREYTDLVLAGKAPTPRGKYGYGFSERLVGGRRVVGHNGGFPGVNAELHILPDTGEVVVVLSNLDPPSATQLADFIVERVIAPR